MTWDCLLGLLLGVAALGYLAVALVRPEDFS
ncbi:potassium-transporting ATPase subunit F [Corynebacterium sp. zg-331]|nr:MULTISPECIES: potassium-transporting ATPase subunit F [unclassified Corynebacterium]MBC3185664.1 potassium-transporting ATPase subunit F [Corynebacterium sp. zg-331]MPV52158.1 potassium-transporting ATPase subunit F [Corynebacterium sp. zg331]